MIFSVFCVILCSSFTIIMIKIVIADAQYLVRVGLKNLLSERKDIKIVGEAVDSKELYDLTKEHQPDVVIFDYNSQKNFLPEDIQMVKINSPKSNFLIISADDCKSNIYKVIELGAISFLTKECDKEEIINAIYATAKNEKFLCHKVIDIIIEKHIHTDEDNCKAFNLSLRETEIIKLTAKGWTAKTIAGHLFLSTHTVYTHKKNIMKKLRINSSSEMIVYAIQNGLITKEEMVLE
ncbi:MAG: two component transcriptional regulator, LuxR family [Bacteroidota bacterium]|nr:two component transcriptional regulator, LuxR family [Bacteroidota bacterium]